MLNNGIFVKITINSVTKKSLVHDAERKKKYLVYTKSMLMCIISNNRITVTL